MKYRKYYDIYPGKACISQPPDFIQDIKKQILQLGREVGKGRGDSLLIKKTIVKAS